MNHIQLPQPAEAALVLPQQERVERHRKPLVQPLNIKPHVDHQPQEHAVPHPAPIVPYRPRRLDPNPFPPLRRGIRGRGGMNHFYDRNMIRGEIGEKMTTLKRN